MEDKIFNPISRYGKMPVPKILFQSILKHDGGTMFQTDKEISKSKDSRIVFEVEPAVKNEEDGMHIALWNFENIGKQHDSPTPRVDVYVLLSEFDKMIEKYLKWKNEQKEEKTKTRT